MQFCRAFHLNVVDIHGNNNSGHGFFDLDDEDVERIQAILDESYEDEDDVEILDHQNEFPMPMKPKDKESN